MSVGFVNRSVVRRPSSRVSEQTKIQLAKIACLLVGCVNNESKNTIEQRHTHIHTKENTDFYRHLKSKGEGMNKNTNVEGQHLYSYSFLPPSDVILSR